MDGRRSMLLARRWSGAPRIQRCEPRPLPRSWAWAVGLVWPVLYVIAIAIAPEPADPNAVPTLLDSLVFTAVVVGLTGVAAAAFIRSATALVWSSGLALLWMGTALACPLSGHHDAAGWPWRFELVASSALLVLSVLGWRRLRTR